MLIPLLQPTFPHSPPPPSHKYRSGDVDLLLFRELPALRFLVGRWVVELGEAVLRDLEQLHGRVVLRRDLCCDEFYSSPDELAASPGHPFFDLKL